MIAVNKADGDPGPRRRRPPRASWPALCGWCTAGEPRAWTPPVVTCSGLTGDGVDGGLAPGAGAPREPRDRRPDVQTSRPGPGLHLGDGPRRGRATPAPVARPWPPSGPRYVRRSRSGELPPTGAADRILDGVRRRCLEGRPHAFFLNPLTWTGNGTPLSRENHNFFFLIDAARSRRTARFLELRRDLHANPELSWHEQRTTDVVDRAARACGPGRDAAATHRAHRRRRAHERGPWSRCEPTSTPSRWKT